MSVKVYENGWRDINNIKRYENGWVNCKFARKYENGQWVDVWSNYSYSWQGPYTVNFSPEYYFDGASAVYYHGELHVFGFRQNLAYRHHFAWNGSSWRYVCATPFRNGSAVVFNDVIYLFDTYTSDSNNSSYKMIYCFNGSSWEEAGHYIPNLSCPVVYNGEIHMFGNNSSTSYYYRVHYKSSDLWNWTKLSNKVPSGVSYSVVFQGELHTFWSKKHCAWNGSSWREVEDMGQYVGTPIVFNDELHSIYQCEHWIWNGIQWRKLDLVVPPLDDFYKDYSSVAASDTVLYVIGGDKFNSSNKSNWVNKIEMCVLS